MVFYTSVFGKYPLKIPLFHRDARVVVFTDKKIVSYKDVEFINIYQDNYFSDFIPQDLFGLKLNRFIKYSSHTLFPESHSVYFDSRILLKKQFLTFLQNSISYFEWMSPKHRYSESIYDELDSCLNANLLSHYELNHFERSKFCHKYTPFFPENGLIFRRNTTSVSTINNSMITNLFNGILRDQLYFHFYISRLKFGYFPFKFNDKNPYYSLKKKPFSNLKQSLKLLKKIIS